jgi:hypothetical protein
MNPFGPRTGPESELGAVQCRGAVLEISLTNKKRICRIMRPASKTLKSVLL